MVMREDGVWHHPLFQGRDEDGPDRARVQPAVEGRAGSGPYEDGPGRKKCARADF